MEITSNKGTQTITLAKNGAGITMIVRGRGRSTHHISIFNECIRPLAYALLDHAPKDAEIEQLTTELEGRFEQFFRNILTLVFTNLADSSCDGLTLGAAMSRLENAVCEKYGLGREVILGLVSAEVLKRLEEPQETRNVHWFTDSPDPGLPECICSLCGRVIEEGEVPVRIFSRPIENQDQDRGQDLFEARFHYACFQQVGFNIAEEVKAAGRPDPANLSGQEDTEIAIDIIRDLLLLVDVDIPVETIATWLPSQRYEAQIWAAKTHLAASDNPVKVPPRPAFISEAQQGVVQLLKEV